MNLIGKMIRDEAYEEGFQEGLEQGLEKGMKKGLDNSRNMLIELVENKFEDINVETLKIIKKIEDFDVLNLIMKKVFKFETMKEFKEYLKGLH